MDIREELAHLRRTVAAIDQKYAATLRAVTTQPRAGCVEELISGEAVRTEFGRHFEAEKLYPRCHRHGSYYISDLADLSPDVFGPLSDGAIAAASPHKLAFLDTETTGLAGGSGTCAFLIGVGRISADGLRVRQFFMRDFGEEASMLASLSSHLAQFDVLVTYNGRGYDQPLLETRYTMNRARHPFARMEHLDLLYGARRLFKVRLDDCRLVNLENKILGFERENDIPGELIPYTYFEYLRTKRAFRLIGVFHHNVQDIVSLACLTGVVPEAFRDPENIQVRHGEDLLGLARWLQISGRAARAHGLMRRAIDLGLADTHLFRTLYECGLLEKKLGRDAEAASTFTDLSLSPNPYRARAYEELAKRYEHGEKNFRMALECTRAARAIEDSEALATRERRLQARCERASGQRALLLAGRSAR